MKTLKDVANAIKYVLVSYRNGTDSANRRSQSQDTHLQIESLEPRVMLNGDGGEVLFRAGFEDASVSAGQFAFFQNVSGFTATNSAVEIQNNHPAVGPASEGQKHLELDGRNGIFVNIDDIQAARLNLEVDYSARGGASVQQNEIEVLWNGSVVETLSADGAGLRSTDFNRFSIDLPIDGGSTAGRLEFRSKLAGSGGLGGLLDNVVVSAELGPIAIDGIPDQEVQRGGTLNVDADLLPPNEDATDTNYQLVKSPVGATIDPATGEFQWEASEENIAATEDRETETVTGPPQVIVFAGFEDVDVSDRRYDFFESTSGFEATGRVVEVQRNHPSVGPASEGNNLVELDGRNGIARSIATKQGDLYELKFDFSPRAGADAVTNAIEILWDGEVVREVTGDGTNSRTTDFETITVNLSQFTGDMTRLEFRSKSRGTGPGLGGLIDNIRVTRREVTTVEADNPFEVIIRANDRSGRGDSEQFNITINDEPVKQAPVFNPIDDRTINEQESISVQFSATDADTPTDQLRYEAIRIPVNATLDPITGQFDWQSDESSGDRFFNIDVKVTDPDGLSDEKRFRLTVNEVNRDPNIFSIDDVALLQDQSLTQQVTATDPDRPKTGPRDILTYSLTSSPVGAIISDTGEISWTPTAAQLGNSDPFEFVVQVADDKGGSATESFNVTINNQSPVLEFIENREIDELELVEIQFSATDPNGNGLVYEVTQSPVNSTFDPDTAIFRWTPNEFAGGFDFFNIDVKVTDSEGLSDSQRFRIVVNEINLIPILESIDDISIDAGQRVLIQAVASDSDVPMDTLAFSLTSAPDGATISDEGLVQWTPAADITEGTFTFTVRVSDGNGGSATESFDVTVGGAVDAITLIENDDFLSTQSREITVGPDVKSLSFQFTPEFDTTANFVNDAFEVALVDSTGQPLTHVFNRDRDAFFNVTEGETAVAGVNTIQTGDTVTLDLSQIAEGTVANLVFRLINNDSDTQTKVTITNIETSSEEIETPLGVSFAENRQQQAPVDFTLLQDVTESFVAQFGQTSFNEQSDALFTNIALTNVGQVTISGRIVAAIKNVSDEQIALIQPDGRLPDGRFYIDVTPASSQVAPGETARTRGFQWLNEASERFQFELSLLAEVNSAPTGFTSTPPIIVEAGRELSYTAVAVDPDEGQVLRYNITRGNEAVTINEDTGVLSWLTTSDNIGNNRITVRATDPFGLFTEQTFTVEVVESLQNRPPTFVTDPVTEATASSGFEITTLATGDNPNGVGVIGGFQGPRIVTINSDDQTVGVYEGTGNDRFDDETTYSTGEPTRTGNAIQSGYTVDVGLPQFLNNTDENDILGLDQADFNGDGILDLATLTYHRSNVVRDGYFHDVVINLGDGNGGFGEPIIVEQIDRFSVKANFENFTVADINGDGEADLLWSLYQQFSSSDSFLFYTIIGNGDGTFQPSVLTTEITGMGDFRVVDLDLDGNVDVVGRRQLVDDIGWMRGVGDGTFEEFVSLSPEDTFTFVRNDRTRAFQVLDLDGDGDIDIIQGRRADKGIQILTNNGDLTFTETDVFGAFPNGGFIYYQAIQVADFTGDGFVDIFYSTFDSDFYYLIKGTADGFEETGVEATANEPHRGAGNTAGDDRPLDIDGDGDLDLVLGQSHTSPSRDNGVRVLLNDGTGFFSNVAYSTVVDSDGQPNQDNQSNYAFTSGVLSGDYNSDGVADLVAYTGNVGAFGVGDYNSVSVLLGTRPGEFAAVRTGGAVEEVAGDVEVVPGDFNNDGIVDLLTLGGGMIELGLGDGTFADPFQATPGRVGDHAVLTDFNNDGIIDLLLATGGRGSGSANGFHQVLLGNGDGTFEQSYLERDAGGGYGAASVADFNNDGFQDFITKSTLFGRVEVLLNDPTDPGTFTKTYDLDLTQNYGYQLDAGDFDEDGFIDFVTIEGPDPRLQTYRGLGDGTFELVNEQFDLLNLDNNSGNSHAGDVNNDGHLDFVTLGNIANIIHLGNGDGTFAEPSFIYLDQPTTTNRSRYTELVDFDQDGNLDFIRGQTSNVLNLYRGIGDGTFAVAERYRFANFVGVPYIADVDNDGHLDITQRPGTGNANLSAQVNTFYGTRDGLVDVLTVDLNGDGNEEVLAINEDNDRLKIFVGDNLGGLTRLNDVLVGRAPRAVATAELDGDGTLELITANRAGRSISVLTGDLEAGYTVVDFDVDGAPVDVEVSDLDGDGNADIVVLDEFNQALWVFSGNGTTTLDAPVAVALGDVASKFVLADANDDGNVDAVVTLPETNRVMIFGGDGSGGFEAPVYVDVESAPSDVAVVDLNDDGNADLAITLPESNVLSVHYGLSGNQFARAQQITVGDTPTRVTAADADEDGRVDLIVTNSGDSTASVIFNRFDPNEVYRYDADAIDPDGDNLDYSVVDGPGGLFIDGTTGEVVWAASPDQVGQHTVIVEANDGNGGVATQQFIIDVQPSTENSAPLIATEPVATIGANESFEYQVNSIDDDNDSLRYRIIDGPAGATIDPVTGLLQWDGRTDAAIQLGYGGINTRGNITVPADESLQPENITVEGWYNFHQLTASNGRMILMKQEGGVVTEGIFNGLREVAYSLHINGNSDLVLQLDLGPEGTETFDLETPFVAEIDRWYHIAFTFDDATREATIYVDGVALTSGVSTAPLVFDSTRNSQVGEVGNFATFATIDNYRIWNVVRSAAEIQEGLTQQYEDNNQIVLDYRFEDNNTISVRDHSSFENTGSLTPAGRRPIPVPGLANAGIHSFTIGVEDGRGGMTTQTFDVEIVAELRGAIAGTISDEASGDGLEDWLVFLDDNDNQFADPDEIQTTTDADGNFQFAGLLPGDYPVRVAPVAGFENIELQPVNVDANADSVANIAATQLPLSQIQGQLQTEDGAVIGYWKVYADLNENGVRESDEPMSVTDRDGAFAIAGLDAGTYNLRADLPAGWVETADGGLEIDLSADTISTGNDIVVAPTNTSVTGGVHFVTTAPTTVQAREVYRYASVAFGLGSGSIAYDISLAPEGFSIDPGTGAIAWKPTVDQLGENVVIIRATDESGSVSLQQFTIEVTAPNAAPVITSIAPAIGFVGKTFAYDVLAQDEPSETLTYSIVSGGSGATIDSDGRLRWSPVAGDVGTVSFEIEVSDSAGNIASQSFAVTVSADDPNATPIVITPPRTEVGLGQRYFARATGTDQLDRALEWSLVSGPSGLNVDADGTIQWAASSSDLGDQTIELLATNADGETEAYNFTLTVVGRPVISNPIIESSPLLSAVIGNEYQYDLDVNDPDGDVLSYELVDAPQGMNIDASRGTIRWTPQADQLGESDVTVEVTDPDGATATQTFTLKVSRAGGPPIITSTPTTEVNVGGSFLYSVLARDAEGDPLNYRLLEAPDGLTIANTTGEISWTPTAAQLGQQTVVIEVSDGFGGAATQAFSVLVGDGIVNLPPQIDSEARRFTSVGSDYEYQITASDPEATTLAYSVSRGPEGLTVDSSGLVTWTPAANQAGQFVVTLLVTDANGASAVESFELDVLAENRAPVINSFAPAELYAGEEFQYDLLVTDADTDPLQFELISGPDGATVDAFGRIRWATNNDLIAAHDFEVRVSDPRGGEASQSFTLNIVADTVAPIVLLSDLSQEDFRNILPWQGPIRVFARASDNVGIASLTLTANGVDIPLDANGQAAFEFDDYLFSNINIIATATDVNGNVTTKSIDVDFDYPEGWTGLGAEEIPTAAITSPAEAGTVVGFASIVGTASHENFGSYTLSYRHFDETEFTTITTSNTAVDNGELGVWDTSLLRNDEYVLRLEVESGNGVMNVVEQNIGLTGELKLGNFQLSFTDMVIPIAGIPIQITRVYDTLQADVEGEFGYGWRLEFRDTNLQVGLPKTGLEDIGAYPAFRPGVKVYLNVPGQGRQGFTFNPELKVLPGIGNDNLTVGRPRFTPDPGVTSTLSTGANGFLTVNERGELYAGGVPYNPAASEFGGAFVLTTKEGITYRINGDDGKLDTATDRNSNSLTFNDAGVVSDSGVGLIFERDAVGRINSITDPNGNSVEYGFTGSRLTSSTDRVGNVTQYIYDNAQSNFLSEVVDPLGRTGLRAEYGSDGRLLRRSEDLNGAAVQFEQLLEDGRTLIRLADGSEQFLAYDGRGRVIEIIDELGNATQRTFDANGLSAQVDALGNKTLYVRNSSGDILQQINSDGSIEYFSYDAEGRLATATDAMGTTTSFEYDNNGNVTQIDNDGLVTRQEFDDSGNLIRRDLPGGDFESYVYSEQGFIAGQTIQGQETNFGRDANGNEIRQTTTVVENGVSRDLTLSRELDANGNPFSSVDSAGFETLQTFDSNNNVVSIQTSDGKSVELDRNGQLQLQGVTFANGTTGSYIYDERNFLVESIAPTGEIVRYLYDAVGNNTAQIFADDTPETDADNPRRTFEYDALRRVIAETNLAGETTTFVYNAAGQVASQTNNSGETVFFEYDAVGNLVRQRDDSGSTTSFAYDSRGNVIETAFADGSVARSTYDDANRVVRTEDAVGSITLFEYDAYGNLTKLTDANENSTLYEYDAFGNLAATIDANGTRTAYSFDDRSLPSLVELADGSTVERTFRADGQVATEIGRDGEETRFSYDSNGRLAEIIFPDGSSEQLVYSEDSRVAEIVDVNGTELREFDDRGRLTRFVSPNGEEIAYEYDAFDRRTAVTTRGVRTEFVYNNAGRILSILENGTAIATNEYDAQGNLIETTFANGVREERTYDTRSRLTAVTILNEDDAVLRSATYEHDAVGQILAETEGTRRVEYEYDEFGQLIVWRVLESGSVTEEVELEYDSVGNNIRRFTNGIRTDLRYDSTGQLVEEIENGISTSYAYDANGNLVSATRDSILQYRYTWDVRGRLTQVENFNDGIVSGTTSYEYDQAGLLIRRVENGVATTYAWDRSQQVANIISATQAGETEHFFHTDRILGRAAEDGDLYFYHADPSQNVRAQSGPEQSLVFEADYAPFGEVLSETFSADFNDAFVDFEFAGELFDDFSSLTYLQQRHLDSDLQRFVSRDPLAGEIRLPLSQQPYQYALNNPLIFSDPTGEFATLVENLTVLEIASAVTFVGLSQVFVNNLFSDGSINFYGVLGGLDFDASPSVGVSVGTTYLLGGFGSDTSFTPGNEENYSIALGTGAGISVSAGASISIAGPFSASFGSASLDVGLNPLTQALRGSSLSGAYVQLDVGYQTITGQSPIAPLIIGFGYGNASGTSIGTNFGIGATATFGAYISFSVAVDQGTAETVRNFGDGFNEILPTLGGLISSIRRNL